MKLNDAWRATLFLSAFFYAFGIQLAYLPVWLEAARGLSGIEISCVIFGASIGRLVSGPVLAAWVDGQTARNASMRLALGAALGFTALMFATGPVMMIGAGFVALSIVYGIGPASEAALMHAVSERPQGINFGQGRAMSSASFVLGVFSGGALIEHIGAHAIMWALIVLFAALVGLGWFSPRYALGTPGGVLSFKERFAKGGRIFRRPTLFLLLLSTGPIQASHAFYYAFSSVVWEQQGFSGSVIGLLWGTGVVIEIVLLVFYERLPKWVTPQRLILAGAAGAVVRWTWYGLAPEPGLTFVLQNLHALSFAATYVGTIQIIRRDVDKEDRTVALTLQAALTTGVLTGLVGLVGGAVYDAHAEKGYWVMAAMAAIGIFFALLMMYRIATRPPR